MMSSLKPTKPFTKASLQALVAEIVTREVLVRDIGCKGLNLRLRPGKRPTWVHVYTYDGVAHRPSLGSYDDVSLDAARRLVEERRRLIALHAVPASPRQIKKRQKEADEVARARAVTVRDLYAIWHRQEIASSHRDEGEQVKGYFERDVLPILGDQQVEKIARRDVMAVIDRIRDRGAKRVANVVLQLLKRLFHYAQVRELTISNPADLVTRKDAGGKERSRDRYLAASEITELAKALPDSGLEETSQAAVLVLMATLVRVGGISAAKWTDIDLNKRIWKAWDQKKHERIQYEVVLSDFAVAQIERIQCEQKRKGIETPWVMYSRKDPRKHVTAKSLNKQIQDRQAPNSRKKRVSNQTLALSGGHWTVHDLRRTGASHMKALGVLREVRRACMNHESDDRLEQVYDREEVPLAVRAEAFRKLGERLEILTGVRSNVVPLRA